MLKLLLEIMIDGPCFFVNQGSEGRIDAERRGIGTAVFVGYGFPVN